MEVICLEDRAFYQLVDTVIARLRLHDKGDSVPWVSPEEAMRLLNVKAKSTMQILRDTGKVRFTQPQKKIILYERKSLMNYLEANSKNTF